MIKKIALPPEAGSVIESTRSLGYSFHDAVADIVDNSVSAGAEHIDIMCDYDCAYPYLSVLDDGCGMDDSELRAAMTYGSKNPLDHRDDSDLGRFGLGLKVASLSQCSCLTVLSKKNGEVNGYCWDLKEVRRDNQWNVLVVDYRDVQGMQIEKLLTYEAGTLVFLSFPHKNTLPYHRFLLETYAGRAFLCLTFCCPSCRPSRRPPRSPRSGCPWWTRPTW